LPESEHREIVMKKTIVMLSLVAFLSVSCTNPPHIENGFLKVNGTLLFY